MRQAQFLVQVLKGSTTQSASSAATLDRRRTTIIIRAYRNPQHTYKYRYLRLL